MNVLMVINVLVVLYLFVGTAVMGLIARMNAPPQTGVLPPIPAADLWAGSAQLMVFLAVLPLAWAFSTRRDPVAGTIRFFSLQKPFPGFNYGLVMGVGILFGLGLILYFLQQVGVTFQNESADRLLAAVDWPLAVALAGAAAIGEEIFFRGFIQRYVGWIGQAVLFAAFHLGYGNVIQLVAPLALGLIFGWLVQRGHSLWMVIAAHFTYDFVQFAVEISSRTAA